MSDLLMRNCVRNGESGSRKIREGEGDVQGKLVDLANLLWLLQMITTTVSAGGRMNVK